MNESEIIASFKAGMSKAGIADTLITVSKKSKKKLSKYEALKIVESAILKEYVSRKV